MQLSLEMNECLTTPQHKEYIVRQNIFMLKVKYHNNILKIHKIIKKCKLKFNIKLTVLKSTECVCGGI